MTRKYRVDGMSCAACSAAVERAVARVPGVTKAEVSLLSKSMNCELDENITGDAAVIDAVKKAGFRASVFSEAPEAEKLPSTDDGTREVKVRLAVSFGFLLPLMYVSMGHMAGLPLPGFLTGVENAAVYSLTLLLLTLPVVFINRKFYVRGFTSLLRGSPNMDTLIASGSTAALVYSLSGMYAIGWGLGHGDTTLAGKYMHGLYFDSAAMILTLVTLGKYFEEHSKKKTNSAVAKLVRLAPKTAVVLRDGRETEIPVGEIKVGDTVVVRPGTRVPVDGTVLEGEAALDESALTGESLPSDKAPGDAVLGASVSVSGFLKLRADRVGKDTTLARIIELVENAGASKAPVARLADWVSGVFVPIVMGVAVLTAAVWLFLGESVGVALTHGVSVLVISCPCALGLATPVAVMAANGRCAGEGILIKSAEALERLHSIKIAAFDKTGTLTEGKPAVTEVVPAKGVSEAELLAAASSLEAYSEHPLARAIVSRAEELSLPPRAVEGFRSLSGRGVSGKIDGEEHHGGNRTYMRELKIDVSSLEAEAERLAESGATPMYFAREGVPMGIIAVADRPRESGRAAVDALRAMGIRSVMLTGDNAVTAEAVRRAVGADEARAGLLPEDKERIVRELKDSDGAVAMVGDGINDSPALASADVGIAVGGGTDIASEAADVVLMKGDMTAVAEAIRLSRRAMRVIKQNLFWAFFYNTLGIPIAAGVLSPLGITLSPMIGAAAMSVSSLFVVTNALRLYRK